MLSKSVILKHYKRQDIQNELVKHAQNKEIGMCYEYGYGKRPDILSYPRDILELAFKGVSSFHSSEELWSNPLSINNNLSKKELADIRIGWDLVLDVDCAVFEYSRICADLIVKFLRYCGVKDISVKFSGNKGFHVGVPFQAFPKQVGEIRTKDLFPEAARKIAFYIKENIKEELGRKIIEFEQGNFSKVLEKTNAEREKAITTRKDHLGTVIQFLNVEPFLEIDTVLIASRHLYRMPYSLHEKSGLVSLPIDPDKVSEFKKSMASPETISIPEFIFLDRNVTGENARQLLLQALDFEVQLEEEREVQKEYQEVQITSPINEDFFPPCIKNILAGIPDGKKRAVFILTNFLGKIGWSKEEISGYLKEWNKKNPEPLREVYIKGQLYNFKPGEKLPPNCNNEGYALGMGVCKPDNLCKRIKNPVNYTVFRWRDSLQDKESDNSE